MVEENKENPKVEIVTAGKSDKPKVKRMKFCDVPDCGGYAISDEVPICRKHFELLRFFTWALNNIRISDEKKTKSGLILPG